ncbi:pantoate--beta-alanine ligase [Parapedobacter koreensis]|uniref:Pantothenate synthetase n=1 Tax=Parapedobacter koreensis TaxID=332977 RepID=A0A1H7EXS3_9SPHI|nr:pantoate--beta-alanine ligase [Parapedobacter koreensis]SEK18661.1 pantoate--beta-alanine ligase [Parapedobacter koreensis]
MPNKKGVSLLEIVKTKHSLRSQLQHYRTQQLRIAFVPTMGALHAGHIALVSHAKKLADVVVCSIFVNPTQFNDPADLEKYPRPIEKDIALLQDARCDVLFLPEVTEMYQPGEHWHIELGGLDDVLEGLHRPGHFQGVTQIVKKLFDAVQPDVACFGQKDFQQYKVVAYMIASLHLPVALEMCPTVREPDGLAMSSRNIRLTPQGRTQALALYRTLLQAKADLGKEGIHSLQEAARQTLENSPGIRLEYFVVYDADTFVEADSTVTGQRLVALVAAWVDGVRLIDNMLL